MTMTFQTVIALFLTALSAGYILRGLLRSSVDKDCASGCGACRSETCGLRKLEAQLKAESKL